MNKKGIDRVKLLFVSLGIFLLIVFIWIFVIGGSTDKTYASRIEHQNAIEVIYSKLQAYYSDTREYPIISNFQDTLLTCDSSNLCLKTYFPDETFDGGNDTTYYYWLSDNKQNVIICVSTINDKPKEGSEYSCTGNGIGNEKAPGKIEARELNKDQFPSEDQWLLIQDWNREKMKFEDPILP